MCPGHTARQLKHDILKLDKEHIMAISRKIGTLIIFGVPVIVGGGIVYYFTHSFPAMFVFEIILAFTALGFIDRK